MKPKYELDELYKAHEFEHSNNLKKEYKKMPLLEEEVFHGKRKTYDSIFNKIDKEYWNVAAKMIDEKNPSKYKELEGTLLALSNFKDDLNNRKHFEIDSNMRKGRYVPILKKDDIKIYDWLKPKLEKGESPIFLAKNFDNKLSKMNYKENPDKYNFLKRASIILKTHFKK